MFKATTRYSEKLKCLFDLLFQLSSSTVKLRVDFFGISSVDASDGFRVNAICGAECFDEYYFGYGEPIYVGLGQHVNAQLKDIKAKTTLTISVSGVGVEEAPYVFTINAVRGGKTKNKKASSATFGYDLTLKMLAEKLFLNYDEMKQRLDEGIRVDGCATCTEIQPCDFVQICKSFKTNSYVVDLQKECGQLHFVTNIAGLSEIKKTFGEYDSKNYELVRYTFKIDQLSKLIKLSALAKSAIKIMFTSCGFYAVVDDGEIGKIRVHVNRYVE